MISEPLYTDVYICAKRCFRYSSEGKCFIALGECVARSVPCWRDAFSDDVDGCRTRYHTLHTLVGNTCVVYCLSVFLENCSFAFLYDACSENVFQMLHGSRKFHISVNSNSNTMSRRWNRPIFIDLDEHHSQICVVVFLRTRSYWLPFLNHSAIATLQKCIKI